MPAQWPMHNQSTAATQLSYLQRGQWSEHLHQALGRWWWWWWWWQWTEWRQQRGETPHCWRLKVWETAAAAESSCATASQVCSAGPERKWWEFEQKISHWWDIMCDFMPGMFCRPWKEMVRIWTEDKPLMGHHVWLQARYVLQALKGNGENLNRR